MTRTRRSAILLLAAGLAGVLFFWLTDPQIGVWWTPAASGNRVDAVNEARPGTWAGLAGSGGVLAAGAWLMSRRVG